MKVLVNIARGFVGGLFIFSGLVKAIDPKGLSYKMQEFFEVWVRDGFLPKLMNTFNEHSLTFSIVIITLEVFLGLALLVGWQKKMTTWLLLLLTLFFTFLTAFVLKFFRKHPYTAGTLLTASALRSIDARINLYSSSEI